MLCNWCTRTPQGTLWWVRSWWLSCLSSLRLIPFSFIHRWHALQLVRRSSLTPEGRPFDSLRAKHVSLGLPTTKRKRNYIRHYTTSYPVSGRGGCWASTVARLQEARHLSFTWCCLRQLPLQRGTTSPFQTDPTSCWDASTISTKWVLPAEREHRTAVNRQSHHGQHGTHRSMRMLSPRPHCKGGDPCGTPFKTFDHGGPHTTMLPETAARPVLLHGPIVLTFAGEYSGFYTLSSR